MKSPISPFSPFRTRMYLFRTFLRAFAFRECTIPSVAWRGCHPTYSPPILLTCFKMSGWGSIRIEESPIIRIFSSPLLSAVCLPLEGWGGFEGIRGGLLAHFSSISAFCNNLSSVTNLSLIPQKIGTCFSTYGKLHVCKGYKYIYEATDVWKKFNIIDDVENEESGESHTKLSEKKAKSERAYYSLNGFFLDSPTTRGVYIIRQCGKNRKFIKK